MDELLNDYKMEMPEQDDQPQVALKGKIIKFTWWEMDHVMLSMTWHIIMTNMRHNHDEIDHIITNISKIFDLWFLLYLE